MSHLAAWQGGEFLSSLGKRLVMVVLLLVGAGCATGSALRLVAADLPTEEGPRYRLFLHGGIGFNDFETVAILDREDDRLQFVPPGGMLMSRLLEGLTATEARQEARQLLGRNNAFVGMESKAIIGPDGEVIGYEIRGRYSPAVGRRGDDLDTTYLPGPDGTVVFYIYYPPEVGSGPDNFPLLTP